MTSGCRAESDTAAQRLPEAESSAADSDEAGSQPAVDSDEVPQDLPGEPDAESAVDQSPLDELMGGSSRPKTEEQVQELREEITRKIEERNQECMTLEGWEYEPMPLLDLEMFQSVPTIGLRPGYGYYESVEFSLWLNDPVKVAEATADQPNGLYYDTLSEAEQKEWEATYVACNDESQSFFQADFPVIESSVPGFNLDQELEILEQRIANDPRITEAWLGWSRCMATEGFDFANREAIFSQLDQDVVIFDEATLGGATALPTDLEASFATFVDQEVAIKQADQSCSGPVEEAETLVRFELETDFIEEFGLERDR